MPSRTIEKLRSALIAAAVAAACLAAASGLRAQTPSVTPEQRQAIESVIREYLLAHPEIIRETVQILQQRERQAEIDHSKVAVIQHKDELFADKDAPVLGNPSGDVTIVEFFDYRC